MQQILNLDGSLVPFLPATLTNDASRGWHVYYHIFNPMTGNKLNLTADIAGFGGKFKYDNI